MGTRDNVLWLHQWEYIVKGKERMCFIAKTEISYSLGCKDCTTSLSYSVLWLVSVLMVSICNSNTYIWWQSG